MSLANSSLIGVAPRGRGDGLAVVPSTLIALLSRFDVDRCLSKVGGEDGLRHTAPRQAHASTD